MIFGGIKVCIVVILFFVWFDKSIWMRNVLFVIFLGVVVIFLSV